MKQAPPGQRISSPAAYFLGPTRQSEGLAMGDRGARDVPDLLEIATRHFARGQGIASIGSRAKVRELLRDLDAQGGSREGTRFGIVVSP
jgi:hypothetical protein